MNLSDENLVKLMAGDDQQAFTAIYRKYWERLFLTAVKVTGSKEDASDIVQEVFLAIWKRRKELDLTASLGAYLQTSIRYKAIHYIEKNITRRNYLETLQEFALAQSTSFPSASSAELMLRVKEIRETIHATVGSMPPKMKAVYQLSRQEELTHKEIAARLDISEETVRKHVQHALRLIRTALGQTAVTLSVVLMTMGS